MKIAMSELQIQEREYAEKTKRPSELVKKLEEDAATSNVKMSHDGVYKIIVNEDEGGQQ